MQTITFACLFFGAFWIRHIFLIMDVYSITTSFILISTYGRAVEGTGLIIHFRKNDTGSNPVRCIRIYVLNV